MSTILDIYIKIVIGLGIQGKQINREIIAFYLHNLK